MMNPSRLKILGLGLVVLGLGLLPLDFLYPTSIFLITLFHHSPVPWISLAGCCFLIFGLACYAGAKGRSAFWAAMVFALSVSILFLTIAIPNFRNYAAQPRSAEARTNLGGIFIAETAFYGKHGRYGTFDEIGFALAGNSNRYTYRIDHSGRPGTVIPAKDGTLTPDNTIVHAGVSADGQSFTASATANLDDDPTLDQWHVNDIKQNLRRADVSDAIE